MLEEVGEHEAGLEGGGVEDAFAATAEVEGRGGVAVVPVYVVGGPDVGELGLGVSNIVVVRL